MTVKLYDSDAYLCAFNATVLKKIRTGEGELIILDQTAFFPESGGQAGDVGHIGGVRVNDTRYYEGMIAHFTDAGSALREGESYPCEVDWRVRFPRMQAHTGEHIVSGLVFSAYGADNVGFHMDGLLMTVDFSLPIDKTALDEIEEKANACVYLNLPVTAKTFTKEELSRLSYRSKIEEAEALRLVKIGDVDLCACCAPHVRNTGEIGLIKILSSQSHRGGVRITLKCGQAAYEDYAVKYRNTLESAALLKAKHDEVPNALLELMKKEESLRAALRESSEKYVRLAASFAPGGEGHCVLFASEADGEETSRIAAAVSNRYKGCCAVFAGDDCKGYRFSILWPNEKYIAFTKDLLASLQGRGGGSGMLIRGSCGAAESQIRETFSALPVLS